MQAVIFTGIQGSGKTSFYAARFLKTHVRISLDMLKTRNKELRFLQLCLETGQKFVIDNTNPTIKDRQRFIQAAKQANFNVIGYLFETSFADAMLRNSARSGKENVSIIGIKATMKKLQPPTMEEGFDALYTVRIIDNDFVIE